MATWTPGLRPSSCSQTQAQSCRHKRNQSINHNHASAGLCPHPVIHPQTRPPPLTAMLAAAACRASIWDHHMPTRTAGHAHNHPSNPVSRAQPCCSPASCSSRCRHSTQGLGPADTPTRFIQTPDTAGPKPPQLKTQKRSKVWGMSRQKPPAGRKAS